MTRDRVAWPMPSPTTPYRMRMLPPKEARALRNGGKKSRWRWDGESGKRRARSGAECNMRQFIGSAVVFLAACGSVGGAGGGAGLFSGGAPGAPCNSQAQDNGCFTLANGKPARVSCVANVWEQ